MVVINVAVTNCQPQTIVIGRRGTYDTMQIAFDLSNLIDAYGNGVAVLAVKRSQDESAYPAVTTQADNTLTWTVSETDTAYVGAGECQLMWYVDGGLAKTIIYPMAVMRDILATSEEAPDAYQTWVDNLTALGAETLQNAQNAEQSASDAETAKDDAVTAKEGAEAAQQAAETAVTHYPKIENNYWMVWDSTSKSYVSTGIQAEGEDGYSPEITITSITGGHRVIITDKDHPQGQSFDVMDGQGGGTSNYADLSNKPKINNVELNGNKTAHDLGLAAQSDIPTVPVQSVNGKTGAVNLASGDIAYDESATYQAGSVGAELQEQTRQLSDLEDTVSTTQITNTVSGAIASFDDGADGIPIRKLVAQIEPVQDLHGYDSPWPAGGGKNKVNYSAAFPIVSNGITISQNDDGSISINGTATENFNQILMAEVAIDNGAWTISGVPTNSAGGNLSIWARNTSGGTEYARTYNGLPGTLNISIGSVYIYCTISSGTTVDNVKVYLQLESGSTATSYAPYSNICPISGHTGLTMTKTGKNILPEYDAYNAGNVVWGGTLANNKANGSFILPEGTYTFSCDNNLDGIYAYDKDGTGFAIKYNRNFLTFANPKAQAVLLKVYKTGVTAEALIGFNYQLELGSTATSYEPYTGTTIPITFPTTIYGGSDEVIGGKLIDDTIFCTFNSAVGSPYSTANEIRFYVTYAVSYDYQEANLKCNRFKPSNFSNEQDNRIHLLNKATIRILTSFEVSDWDAYLSENPVEISYKVETPTEYTLTPAELTTLYGTNNIWSSTGDTEVTYPADTKLYIENLTQPEEDDMTANANIAANTFFMIGNTLYYSTAAIAQGATIIPGTNCNVVSLADALNQLNT